MAIVASISTCFRKCVDFTGKASRGEFGWFLAFTFVVCAVAHWLGLGMYAVVVLALPLSAATIRRVHDSGLTARFALMLIIAPFAIFYFFSAIQHTIETLLGFDVPYDLIANIPATAAFLFFGFVLVGVLIRKDEASRANVSPKRTPSPWGISSAASTANPAAKVRLDAGHHVTGMTTTIMKAFGIKESGGNSAAMMRKPDADACIATVCTIILDLCAYYGHGIYAPQFDKLFAEIKQQLQASDWRIVLEGGLRTDVENQAYANILRDHASELRNLKTDIDVSSLLRAEKDRIVERDNKITDWPRLAAYYAPKGVGTATFIAIEKSQTSYADTYLRIRLALAEQDGLIALKILRSSTLYESFRYSFSDCPPAYPAFGNRTVVGTSPVRNRDGLGISLKIIDLGSSSFKLLQRRGLHHPYCYVDFEMHERMM